MRKIAASITRVTVVQEMQALARNPDMHIPLSGFAQSRIDAFSFDDLDNAHKRTALVLQSLLMAVIVPLHDTGAAPELRADTAGSDSDPAADLVIGTQGEDVETQGQNRKLAATSALSMLAYAHSKNSNLFQVIMGYYAFASGVKKRSMESLYQIGCMVTYESVLRVLQANARATEILIQEKARTEQFLISFDNLNFYRSKKDQTLLNWAYLENYTAGFVTFMGRHPHLSLESVNHGMVNNLSCSNILLRSAAVQCHQEAARASACQILLKYMPSTLCAQTVRNPAGKLVPKYSMWELLLINKKCHLGKADILPLPVLARNEAKVVDTIDILQDYIEVFGIPSADLKKHKFIINGDLMTVQNIGGSIFRRQDESHLEDKFD